MFEAVGSPYLVPFDGSFRVADAPTGPPADAPHHKALEKHIEDLHESLQDLQRRLYAEDRYAVLLIFQAMDAAGKDGTIRAVMSGVDPAGCQVFAFKRPSDEDLDHDFLWRTVRCLPERGRIGIFNRSYYEEVLVVRVHPDLLDHQQLPERPAQLSELWQQRYRSIAEHEQHLARSGTVVIKLWLNVSRDEQARRFLSRIEEPEKNWKFSLADVEERRHWDAYMAAYETALNATSRPHAPWYAIPADDKTYMRWCVADVLVRTLSALKLAYPKVDEATHARFKEMRRLLEGELK